MLDKTVFHIHYKLRQLTISALRKCFAFYALFAANNTTILPLSEYQ